MLSDKTQANDRYSFYSRFAELPEITCPMVEGIQGLVHDKLPEVELPADMEYLLDSATSKGLSLQEMWEAATREVFCGGRQTFLADLRGGASKEGDLLYLCPYIAESLINWRVQARALGGLATLVVLRETGYEPNKKDPYEQDEVTIYRELALDDAGNYWARVWQAEKDKDPVVIPAPDVAASQLGAEGWFQPVLRGKAFKEIPVTVVNATDRGFAYGPIPVWPLVKRALAIFRRSADYNRALYVKGDPQPVLFGVRDDQIPQEIGGGAIWAFENPEGSAKFLDIDGQGIPLIKAAIQDDYDRFYGEAGHLLETQAKGVEAAEALRIRQAMKQVTAKSLVKNVGDGVQEALRMIGRLMGKSDPEVKKIIFRANLDFAEKPMTGQDFLQFVQALNQGAPMSLQTFHEDHLQRRQMTSVSWEEEQRRLESQVTLTGFGLLGRDSEEGSDDPPTGDGK